MPENIGIAKTSEQAQTQPTQPITHEHITEGVDAICYEQVPVDVYAFFDAPVGSMTSKEVERLKDISDWAFSGSRTLGDGLQKLRSLEIQLGMPTGKDTRQDKIWRWVKMQQQIEDLMKRQGAI